MTNSAKHQDLVVLFESLIARSESETLDFKRDAYNLSDESKQVALVKDIVCMYNTPREEAAHIVIGVKDYPDLPKDICGIDLSAINTKHLDQSSMQSAFRRSDLEVNPVPRFNVETFQYKEKTFAIITIPVTKESGPCQVITSKHDSLKTDRTIIYWRRGTDNDITKNVHETHQVMQWFRDEGKGNPSDLPQLSYQWDQFLEASFIHETHGFDSSRKYLIVTSPFSDNTEKLTALSAIPATFVLDFDPYSDTSGFLYKVQGTLKRSLHIVVKQDRPIINPEGATYWFFVRGLAGRQGTVETETYKTWKRHYGAEIDSQLEKVVKAITPAPITCIILWYQEPELIKHLKWVLDSAQQAFGEAINFVIATSFPGELREIEDEVDVQIINIPLHQLCSGLEVLISRGSAVETDECQLPSSSNAPIGLTSDDQMWLEEELELVHLNIGLGKPNVVEPVGRRFLRGAEITWHELNLNWDVNRDKMRKVKQQVETELLRGRAWRVNLYHEAGAGGTTVARRILWEFHHMFPAAILKRSTPETWERLAKVATLTGQSVLLLIDSSKITERQVNELYDNIRSNQVSVVLLHAQRRSTPQTEKERVTHLEALLSNRESWQFVEKFSQFTPAKRQELERLVSNASSKVRTPFYFGLQTFGHEFLGIERYVSSRLKPLSPDQKKILLFLSIAHHYAQNPIKAQAFAEFLGIPLNRSVNFREAFDSCKEALELLIEVEDNSWRIIHDLIAREILEQGLIATGADRRTWNQNLSRLAKDFAEFCRGNNVIPSEEILELVRRVFIYRNNLDVLGTEKAAVPQSFSQLLQDIPLPAGRLETLKQLVHLYPEEAHFWAHLGRFYASQEKNFVKAFECIDQAIALTNGEDHVLHHMKGMAIRYQINNLVAEKTDIQTIVNLAKEASCAFEEARAHSPDDEHGYISEVQLLTKVLDYAGRQHPNGLLSYLATPGIDPFLLNSLERSEDLFEQVRRNREGQGEPSPLEVDCRAKLDALYGRHEQALQTWNNLLGRTDTYHPPLRRQIIWTYLVRKNRSWKTLPSRDVQRIVSLLEENLEEEPSNDKDLRLWIRAVRLSTHPPSIESVIEQVSYWKTNSGTLDSCYYLYLLYVMLALQGSLQAKDSAERYMEECRQMARFRRNRTKSFEWLGHGNGIKSLVHHSELGQWKTNIEFWERTAQLIRVRGRVNRVDAPQKGYIELTGGLLAFYVPARSNHNRGRSENQPVEFYLGFSYDGLRAWEVKNIEKDL